MTNSKNLDKPKEGEGYYFENGFMAMTVKYHLKRGHCCKSGCGYCSYGYVKEIKNAE